MSRRPNIVIMTSHDTGRLFGCYGHRGIHSPRIDALADQGVLFSQMFATAPVCSPSRASLMTGRYPQRHGLMGIAMEPWNWDLANPRQHLSHVLREAGYQCVLLGDQHETMDVPSLGFERLGPALDKPPRPGREHFARAPGPRVAEGFRQFLADRDHARPFYAQIGFFETHKPFGFGGAAPEPDVDLPLPEFADADPQDRALRERYAAIRGAVRRLDESVGMVLDALRDAGLEDDTLVIFNVDHGPELPRAKWTLFDAGLGIGFIARWPAGGAVGGRRCDWMLSNIDVLPTLAELVEAPFADDMDGVSFAPALTGGGLDDAPPPREELFAIFISDYCYAARTPRYKLIRNFSDVVTQRPLPRGLEPVELYDLRADPHERVNVADDPAHRAGRDEMSDRMWAWLERVDDPTPRRPIITPAFRAAAADYHDRHRRGQGDAAGERPVPL